MKKLLLIILPLLLFFGVSFWDVYDFSWMWTPVDTWGTQWNISFWIFWASWNTILLDKWYMASKSWVVDSTCTKWWLWKRDFDTNSYVALSSWSINYAIQSWELNINTMVWPWLYKIMITTAGSRWTNQSCTALRQGSSADWQSFYSSWFLVFIWGKIYPGNTWTTTLNDFTVNSYKAWVNRLVFSWTDPRIYQQSPTVYYGGTSTGIQYWWNVYLNWYTNNPTLSWTHLKFTWLENIYRALFRLR